MICTSAKKQQIFWVSWVWLKKCACHALLKFKIVLAGNPFWVHLEAPNLASHTHETQEIWCFYTDLQIILLSLFELLDYIKVAKNAGAFLSRCSELLDLSNKTKDQLWPMSTDRDTHLIGVADVRILRLTVLLLLVLRILVLFYLVFSQSSF